MKPYFLKTLFLFTLTSILTPLLGQGIPKQYALLFAVNRYDDPGLRDLQYPIVNAQMLAAALQKEYGFEVEVVETSRTLGTTLVVKVLKSGDRLLAFPEPPSHHAPTLARVHTQSPRSDRRQHTPPWNQ